MRSISIVPYRGFGTSEKLYLRGRVVEDDGIRPASEKDRKWRNLLNMYRRFANDGIPGSRLVARFQGRQQEVIADKEGYFELWLQAGRSLPAGRLWHPVDLELLAPVHYTSGPIRSTGHVLVPPPSARFGVISDMDDTVVHTNATSMLRMAYTVLLGNAHTRVPFEGVAAFYQALQAGDNGASLNPLFYVSNSPWNLYEVLAEFLDIQHIPAGPLMLHNWSASGPPIVSSRRRPHKVRIIRQILDLFAGLPFLLIGDSGEEDPEIYRDIIHQYPRRILAVYIRNISRKPERPQAIRALAEEMARAGTPLLLVDNTWTAAQHAAAQGWISPARLPMIWAGARQDSMAGAL